MPKNGLFADDGRVAEAFADVHRLNNEARFDVEKYRTDESMSDSAVLNAAFAAVTSGRTIVLGAGRTYSLSSTFAPAIAGLSNISIDGNGATIDGSAVAGRAINIEGSFGAATSLLSNVSSPSNKVTLASVAGIVPGMLLWIQSQGEIENTDRPTVYKEEIARVSSVSGNVVTLEGTLYNTYQISYGVTVTPVNPLKNLHITNLHIKGSANNSTIQIKGFDGIRMNLVSVDSPGATDGIVLYIGMDAVIDNSRAENVNRVGYGYGFHLVSAHDCTVSNSYGRNNRHTIDADRARNLRYIGITAVGDTSAGISTHGSTDGIVIMDCATIRCGGGIITRGKNTTIQNNYVKGSRPTAEVGDSYVHGIRLGDQNDSYGLGNAGTGLRVINNTVDVSDFYSDTEQVSALYCCAQTDGARISGNRFIGATAHVVAFVGDKNAGLYITDNYVDGSRGKVGSYASGIVVVPNHNVSGNVTTSAVIEGNSINSTQGYGITVAGGSDIAYPSNNVQVRRNKIGVTVSARVNLSQYWGTNTEVTENLFYSLVSGDSGVFSPVTTYVRNNNSDKPVRILGSGQELGARLRSGMYYGPNATTVAPAAATQSRMYAVPVFVPRLVRLNRLAVNVTTAAAGSTIRLAIYRDVNDGQGGYPGDKVPGSEVSVSGAAVAFVEGVIDAYLEPGLYWLVSCSQGGAPTLSCITYAAYNIVGYQAAGVVNGRISWVVDGVTGAFPDTFDISAPNAQGNPPVIQFKVV